MSGKRDKLKIVAYNDHNFKKKYKTFRAQLNPETYKRDFKIKLNKKQAAGTTGKPLKFKKMLPQTLSLQLLFDRTGVVEAEKYPGASGPGPEAIGVDYDLNFFKDVTYAYNGKKHRPRYLILSWGNLLFKCCLESMSISYKLFGADGKALRAVLQANFAQFTGAEFMVKKQRNSSPDLMHRWTVQEGDTLPQLAHEVYGDSKYYIEVAKANRLIDFRTLKVGSQIFFPPINK